MWNLAILSIKNLFKVKILRKYQHWLHSQWPSGIPEKGPEVFDAGDSSIDGIKIVGDLTGIPLLKLSIDSGAKAIQSLIEEEAFESSKDQDELLDVAIIGAGVSGLAAAVEAKKNGLAFKLFEGSRAFSTIENFPKKKPIFTYPSNFETAGDLKLSAVVKEELLTELHQQLRDSEICTTSLKIDHIEGKKGSFKLIPSFNQQIPEPIQAKRVIVAIGRSGDFQRLGIPGEDLEKVSNRLHDPQEFIGKNIAVIGGGDSALEAASSIAELNAVESHSVSLIYRQNAFSRPKPEIKESVDLLVKSGKLDLFMGAKPLRIDENIVLIKDQNGKKQSLKNDFVFTLIGRKAPLDFFRRSKLKIKGETNAKNYFLLLLFFLAMVGIYGMKTLGWGENSFFNPGNWMRAIAPSLEDKTTWIGTLLQSSMNASFWVTFAYSLAVFSFGMDRIRRRKTPYIKLQTVTLMSIQWIPLFLLPELLLPWMGQNGWIPPLISDNLFPDEQYWKAYGFILAWPLMAWNVFTSEPNLWWLILSFIQTFLILPLIVYRWGKGAYCGWICSCGALAETMGDKHRHKMPHGPLWNKLNFVGQAILLTALVILILHIFSWIFNEGRTWGWIDSFMMKAYWRHTVDYLLAGVLGMGLYFWLSGRVWCRFACPLAALMHIYARVSQFRIFSDKKKCISCNVCTSVCHQGIDIMNFANKGLPMEDPECVRCSACVQSCPTGVLSFGRIKSNGNRVFDELAASEVQVQEAGSMKEFLKEVRAANHP